MTAALVEAALAYLEGEVFSAVEKEQPGLLTPGSVTAARAAKNRQARRDKPTAASVEIVFVRRRDKPEGIDSDRVALDFDLRCLLRRKDLSEGKDQARITDEIARALVRRFRRTSELTLAAAGASFRYAAASIREVDEDPRSGELARSIVRLTLVFSEVLS